MDRTGSSRSGRSAVEIRGLHVVRGRRTVLEDLEVTIGDGVTGLLGTFIPPLGGVIIADFFLRWRRGIPAGHAPAALDWRNIATYAVASGVAYWSKEAGVGIPPLFGIVVAVVVAVALDRTRTERVVTP